MKILIVVAHPDDMEFKSSGTAMLYARRGYEVRVLSACNGCGGHHILSPEEVRVKRYGEIQKSAALLGVKYDVFSDIPDAAIMPDLETRRRFIRYIREFSPDLIITHRTNDYHADHRNVATLIQDASYMLTVPNECPDVPAMRRMPVIVFQEDRFKNPVFSPDIVIDISEVIEKKFRLLDCHASQVYEWLPYVNCDPREVPPESDTEARFKWLVGGPELGTVSDDELDELEPFGLYKRFASTAAKFRSELIAKYGDERGGKIRFAEAFEISEYGAPLTKEKRELLFSF